MRIDARPLAGLLIFVGAAQFFVGMLVAESLYPGYSMSGNYISDLGATCTGAGACVIHQPTANIFNGSVLLLGALAVAAAYLYRRAAHTVILPVLLLLTGVGALGVGTFTETFGVTHEIVSLIAFLFGGLAALWSHTILRAPFRYLAVVLGAAGLVALVLFMANNTLGLGVGGMERMVVYPELLWALGFGAHLMSAGPEAVAAATPPTPP